MKGEKIFAALHLILFIFLSLLGFIGDTADINWDEAPIGHDGLFVVFHNNRSKPVN